MKHVIRIILSLMLLASGSWAGQFGQFRLRLDGTIETPAELSSVSSQPVPRTGQTVTVQLFLPAGASSVTLGYDIEFRMVGKNIADYLDAPTGTTWDGTALTVQGHKVSALLIGSPTIPQSGHLATVSFSVLQNFNEGDVLAVSVANIGDVNSFNDALNVTRASVLYSTRIEAVNGDFDLDGDVDFVDFLEFAQNFNHQGEVPSPPDPVVVTLVDTIRDTIQTTIWDTMTVTRVDSIVTVVNDTIYLIRGGASVAAPTNLTATSENNQVLLSWEFPSNWDGFMVQRADLSGGSSSPSAFKVLELSLPINSFTDSAAESGVTYVYRVSTNLSGQVSDPSDIAVITTP